MVSIAAAFTIMSVAVASRYPETYEASVPEFGQLDVMKWIKSAVN